eukprot:6697659-Prymnesium_polylepis.1
MAEEAFAAVAEFQADWDDDVSGCCEPVNERERLLAYVLCCSRARQATVMCTGARLTGDGNMEKRRGTA